MCYLNCLLTYLILFFLDCLMVVKNAPGFSRYNRIEHLWSVVNRKWSGVVLPRIVEGQEKEPNGPNEEVHNKCINILSNLLDGQPYDGHKINAIPHLCNQTNVKIGDSEVMLNVFDDLNQVKQFWGQGSKASQEKLNISKQKELQSEIKLIYRHIDKRSHSIYYRKCSKFHKEKICGHCQENPMKLSDELLQDLPSRQLGGLFWTPSPDPQLPDHNKTFIQMTQDKKKFKPDEHIEVESCPVANCLYVIKTKAERKRHLVKVHKISGNFQQANMCTVCQEKFPSRKALQAHQKKHKKVVKNPSKRRRVK